MKNSKVVKGILLVFGSMFLIAGAFALFSPMAFTARNGIDISGNISLFNDYRSMGGLLLGSALVILMGAFNQRMAYTSVVVTSVVGTTFSLARVLSIIMDGMPTETLVKATVVEVVLAALAIFAWLRYRERS